MLRPGRVIRSTLIPLEKASADVPPASVIWFLKDSFPGSTSLSAIHRSTPFPCFFLGGMESVYEASRAREHNRGDAVLKSPLELPPVLRDPRRGSGQIHCSRSPLSSRANVGEMLALRERRRWIHSRCTGIVRNLECASCKQIVPGILREDPTNLVTGYLATTRNNATHRKRYYHERRISRFY